MNFVKWYNKVIATGDSLFGSTVTNLSLSSKGLNNSNQLAFFALLADGTSVIGRAQAGDVSSPKSVPEPTLVSGLLAVGALGALLLSSRFKVSQQPQLKVRPASRNCDRSHIR